MRKEIWTRHRESDDVIVAVHAENRASWRSLERAGFRRIDEGQMKPDNPSDSTDHYIYRAGRRPS